jgi:hypothetical protein
MPSLSNGKPVRLIDDRGAIGLRQCQHADENCEQADEADGLHGSTSHGKWQVISKKGGPARLCNKGGVFDSPNAPNCTPASPRVRGIPADYEANEATVFKLLQYAR